MTNILKTLKTIRWIKPKDFLIRFILVIMMIAILTGVAALGNILGSGIIKALGF